MTESSAGPATLDTSTAEGPHAGRPVALAGAPLGKGRGAVIMVHGRGAGARNILDLARALDRPDFTWIAPEASGSTWYPNSFMAPRATNQPGLSSGLAVIQALVSQVKEAGIPGENLLLLGFSQGACLASEFAYRNPGRYGGVIVYSGGLIGPPGTEWAAEGSFEETPVFLGCSDVDPHVPRERLDDSARVFGAMGATVTKRIYPGMGHLVNEDEIEFTRQILDGVPPLSE
jgi:phospholipase/carboxylesterase